MATARPMRPRLVADIGGTNARFALSRPGQAPGQAARLACGDYPDLEAALKAYLARHASGMRPAEAALAVAAPVTGDVVEITNHPWRFSIDDVRRELGFERLVVINDLSAVALSLPQLASGDLRQIGGGGPVPRAAKAVLAPGTGLGVSGLIPAGGSWLPLAGEGGHVDFAPANEREIEILRRLSRRWPHVSAERLLSGAGLVNLYQAIAELDGEAEGGAVEAPDPPDIVAQAQRDDHGLSRRAVRQFCAILGAVAGDLVLTLGARGGVYIAGGIVAGLGPAFDADAFRRRFEAKGRFSDYLAEIPAYVILLPNPALLGLARLLDEPAAP